MSPRANVRVDRVLRFALAGLVGTFLCCASAFAQPVFIVNSVFDELDSNTADGLCRTVDNTCTLRAAVMQANRMSGSGVTIRLPAGTFVLTRPASGVNADDNGDLNLIAPSSGNPVITIVGAGSAATVIDANEIDRVLSVAQGRTAVVQQVSLRNGFVGASQNGGGVFNAGTLTLYDTQVLGSEAASGNGGGLYSQGSLEMIRSNVIGNRAENGGGIYATVQAGETRLTQCNVLENHASNDGGGIMALVGSVTIRESTSARNTSQQYGGGLWNNANAILINVTLSGNNALRGGGILNAGSGVLNVYNTTVFDNRATEVKGSQRFAGGVYTIGTFNLRNTLVGGNVSGPSNSASDCIGVIVPYGRNLLSTTQDCTVSGAGPGEVTLLNGLSGVGVLQLNGGLTATHALLAGSNAIDGADPFTGCLDSNSVPIPTDQRGMPRVFGARCDVGAYESGDGLFRNGFE